jgi:hypothetical protein
MKHAAPGSGSFLASQMVAPEGYQAERPVAEAQPATMPREMFTRLGYVVIIAIMAVAGAAIAFVVWPSGSSEAPAITVTPAAPRPTIAFERVIDFTRLGAVLTIDAQGQDVTVTFREDFDTSGFNTTSHVFQSSLQPGQDVVQVLEAAGIAVNGPGGVTVTKR